MPIRGTLNSKLEHWSIHLSRQTLHPRSTVFESVCSNMGECRIRIILAKELLLTDSQGRISIARTYSADTTVREAAENTNEVWELYSSKVDFQLWDCTVHPPKNITDWPVGQFSQVTGPKSKTLQDAGWFPSGIWMVLPTHINPSQFSNADYEDFQYNQQQPGELISSGKVQFADSSLMDGSTEPLPSQVMASVSKRFQADAKATETQVNDARALRLLNQVNERKRRIDRAAKLDQRIERLEAMSSEKTKKVSNQVRRMLVKSRATGDKRLEQKDRLYFECLVDNGTEDEALDREFRFFSPQDTFARVGSSFEWRRKEKAHTNVEVLVKRSLETGEEYRRLPVTMRLYEALSGKFLKGDLDTIIVRWVPEGSNATPSVHDLDFENDSIQEVETIGADVDDGDSLGNQKSHAISSIGPADNSVEDYAIEDKDLTDAIIKMDAANNKKPNKVSATSNKVRNMLMKSKASGDSKRIPTIEDRFFLEVVLIDKATRHASSKFYFLADRDPLDRILQLINSSSTDSWEFLVRIPHGDDAWYKRIEDTSIQLSEAATQGILNSFDRLILIPR